MNKTKTIKQVGRNRENGKREEEMTLTESWILKGS
jgi:hypothetical protein